MKVEKKNKFKIVGVVERQKPRIGVIHTKVVTNKNVKKYKNKHKKRDFEC